MSLLEQTSLTEFMFNEHSAPVYLCKEHVGLTKNTVFVCQCVNILSQSHNG